MSETKAIGSHDAEMLHLCADWAESMCKEAGVKSGIPATIRRIASRLAHQSADIRSALPWKKEGK